MMPINQSKLSSAKRGKKEKIGIHGWHPYYAGYSEAFVESALEHLECTKHTIVLDPWCGSGTTNIVSARNEFPSIGIEINPVMSIFAAAKAPQTLKFTKELDKFFSTLGQDINHKHGKDTQVNSAILNFFTPKTANFICEIIRSNPFESRYVKQNGTPKNWSNEFTINSKNRVLNAPYAYILSVVFRTLREFFSSVKSSNPTWSKKSIQKISISKSILIAAIIQNHKKMIADLKDFYSINNAQLKTLICYSDSRTSSLKANSIDRVITSPPYLTRIDYAVSTSMEMSLLGDHAFLAFIRENTMGAPIITKSIKSQNPKWGAICNNVLASVRQHHTKAAESYYWKNMIQYFSDAHNAICEIHRVLKSSGRGLIVVQSSYFKDIEIPLGEIYVEILKNNGFNAFIAYRQEVKNHMAHVNTRSSLYKNGKVYYEDFVEFIKK